MKVHKSQKYKLSHFMLPPPTKKYNALHFIIILNSQYIFNSVQ